MKNEIKNKIDIAKEVLSALPKNNEKNTIRYINEANKIYANFNNVKIQLVEEIKQRVKTIDNIVRNQEEVNFDFSEIKSRISLLTKDNTPYEKLNLDKTLYNLSKFYNTNLKDINQSILEAINSFNKVGIILKEKDFIYDEYQREYMKEILVVDETNLDSLNVSFENYYWKSPNIIFYIEFNFRSLYNKHKKKFEKYVTNLKKELNQNVEDIVKEYKESKISYDLSIDRNSKIYLNNFVGGVFDVKDYNKDNISKLLKELFDSSVEIEPRILFNLEYTLNEYKIYLKYKNIIESIKEELKGKTKDKLNSAKKLKEISKLESLLSKLNRKKANNRTLQIEETIEKIKVLYKEYDELYYKENLYKNLTEDSKIIDGLKFITSYYEHFIVLSKKENEDMTIEEIEKNLEELKEFVLSPYNNIINNLNLLGDYNIPVIIMDKYKLYNMNITLEDLEEENLEVLMKKVNTICNYHKINNLENLNIEKIIDYVKLEKLLKNLD